MLHGCKPEETAICMRKSRLWNVLKSSFDSEAEDRSGKLGYAVSNTHIGAVQDIRKTNEGLRTEDHRQIQERLLSVRRAPLGHEAPGQRCQEIVLRRAPGSEVPRPSFIRQLGRL